LRYSGIHRKGRPRRFACNDYRIEQALLISGWSLDADADSGSLPLDVVFHSASSRAGLLR
jgi:hypothetical protein